MDLRTAWPSCACALECWVGWARDCGHNIHFANSLLLSCSRIPTPGIGWSIAEAGDEEGSLRTPTSLRSYGCGRVYDARLGQPSRPQMQIFVELPGTRRMSYSECCFWVANTLTGAADWTNVADPSRLGCFPAREGSVGPFQMKKFGNVLKTFLKGSSCRPNRSFSGYLLLWFSDLLTEELQ